MDFRACSSNTKEWAPCLCIQHISGAGSTLLLFFSSVMGLSQVLHCAVLALLVSSQVASLGGRCSADSHQLPITSSHKQHERLVRVNKAWRLFQETSFWLGDHLSAVIGCAQLSGSTSWSIQAGGSEEKGIWETQQHLCLCVVEVKKR